MKRTIFLALAIFLLAAPVCLGATQGQIQSVLSAQHSPLPAWTIYYAQDQGLDVPGYLAVVQAESGLGTTGKSATFNNPGNIRFGGWRSPGDPKGWYLWQGGYFVSGGKTYGSYPTMYWGQRATIRLLLDLGYNDQLKAHDWWGFARRYFGNGPGLAEYVENLRAAHQRYAGRLE